QHGVGQPRRHSSQAIEHLPRRAGGTGGDALAAFDVLQRGVAVEAGEQGQFGTGSALVGE
ncbi:MAG: hypothetical protein ACK55I_14725, partial [bacterium]